MESLALLAAAVVLSVIALGALAVVVSSAGYRDAGALLGMLAIASGCWLANAMPHAWLLYGPVVAAGTWAVWRLVSEKSVLP